MTYLILKYLHVLGAIVLLGTGTGIAFFMLMAHRSGKAEFIAQTAGVVVLADMVFTASAAIVQPITGYLLMREVGYEFSELWISAALGLYVVTGCFWLPVVWMQSQMHKLAKTAVMDGLPLPPRYYSLFRMWFLFGIPGFSSVAAILWLMIAKPSF